MLVCGYIDSAHKSPLQTLGTKKLQSNVSDIFVELHALLQEQAIFPEDFIDNFWIAHHETSVFLSEDLIVHFWIR